MNEDDVLTLGELRRLSVSYPDDTPLLLAVDKGGGEERWFRLERGRLFISGNIPDPPFYCVVIGPVEVD